MSYYYGDDSFEDEIFTPGAGPSCSRLYVDEAHGESGYANESDVDNYPSVDLWLNAYIAHEYPSLEVPFPHHSLHGTYLEVPTLLAPHVPAQAAHWDNVNESTAVWPLPVPITAAHTCTEAVQPYIPTSDVSDLMGVFDPAEAEEHPSRRRTAPFSSLMGTVHPIQGPWIEMARQIVEAPRDTILRVLAEVPPQVPVEEATEPVPEPVPELPPSPETVSEPVPLEHHVHVEEGPKLKKAMSGKGCEVEVEGASSAKIGRRIVKRPRMPPIAGCGRFSVTLPSDYAARERETAGERGQMLVVHPQAHGSAPPETTVRSTTSTHRVGNPTGEPVTEAIPQSIGGPSTATPGEEQRDARKRKRADPHVCDGTDGCSKRLSCPYDMPRHRASLRHGGERRFACDDCKSPFVRKDEVLRHKREACPHRVRTDDGDDGLEGGGGAMGGMENGLLSG